MQTEERRGDDSQRLQAGQNKGTWAGRLTQCAKLWVSYNSQGRNIEQETEQEPKDNALYAPMNAFIVVRIKGALSLLS